MKGMKIPALSKLISRCWRTAEEVLRQNVEKKFPDRDEEIITELFHAELEVECNKVSATGAVETAFLSDLRASFPEVPYARLSYIAHGLIATVNFHSRSVEETTGGDFGVVLIRPDVQHAAYFGSELTIERDYQRGLLCQAKIFRRNGTWGGLTSHQREILPAKLNYLAIVLYRYLDQSGERRQLAPFQWQLTSNANLNEIHGWLVSDEFPNLQESCRILEALARDHIGTDDKRVIAQFIAPPLRPSLEIHIRWRDGDGPGDRVRISENNTAHRQQVVQRG
jgi:hypothetical protein